VEGCVVPLNFPRGLVGERRKQVTEVSLGRSDNLVSGLLDFRTRRWKVAEVLLRIGGMMKGTSQQSSLRYVG
jgi:hypothetical protein